MDDRIVDFLEALLTTVPGWVVLIATLVFFGFLGFKIFVGTYSDRLLRHLVIRNHEELCSRFDRLSQAIVHLKEALEKVLA